MASFAPIPHACGAGSTAARRPATPQIVRGPYLQSGTRDSIVVRWRTDRACPSLVRYGSSPNALRFSSSAPGSATEHVVQVKGLKPDTRYFYAIGLTNAILAGADPSHSFVTDPGPEPTRPARVWVLGDSGTKNSKARAVRDAYARYTGKIRTDVILMLGDNAYSSGTDAEYQAAVFDMYPEQLRQCVLWPTLGNHDGRSASSATQSGVYYDIFTLPTRGQAGGLASGTEAYFSFDHGDVHYVCLDSFDTDRSRGSAMLLWLGADLEQNRRKWTIAFWHHPPYTRGSHDSDNPKDSSGALQEMRENVLPILEAGGVDLVLCGHSHSYERSFLVDGHYGRSDTLAPTMIKDRGEGRSDGTGAYRKPGPLPVPHEGSVYIVAGSSGQVSGGRLNHPVMAVSLNTLGSLVLDVGGQRLDAALLDELGAIRDRFTILKDASH